MADMYPVELKHCPFCGSNNAKLNYSLYYSNELCHVQCYDCYCTTALFRSAEQAVEAWNRRADNG